jgi:peptidoglycan/LPS O-acetylase OafA/YrhL
VGRRFENLQALRAVAALLIVGFHVAEWELHYGVKTPVVRGLRWYGGFGIDLFFALSGFIITHAHFQQLGHPRAAPRYLARRLWRIVPTYWVMMLVAAALGSAVLAAPVFAPGWETRWLYWLTLQPGGPPNAFIPPAWSLVYEMAFYVVFAVLFLVPRRVGFALLGLWGTAIVVTSAAEWRAANPYPALLLSPLILEFLFGCAAAVLVVRGCTRGGRTAVAAGVLGCAGGVLAIYLVTNGSGIIPLLPRMLWFGPCCALIVYGLAAAELRGRVFAPRLLRAAGDASYSIYLFHYPVGPCAVAYGCYLPHSRLPHLGWLAVTFAVCVAGGFLLHYAVERPLLRLARTRRTSQPAVVETIRRAA